MAKDFADINRLEHEAGIQAPEAGSKDELVNKFVKAWENQTARRVAKGGTGLTMALTLAACGSDSSGVVNPSGGTDDGKPTKPVETLIALVDGGITTLTGADPVVGVPNPTAGADALETTIDGDGTGTLELRFEDADDTVTLAGASDLSGYDTLAITAGTVDVTGVDLSGITSITVSSGVVMSFAQFAGLEDGVTGGSDDSTVEIVVSTAAEAALVAATIEKLGGTLSGSNVTLSAAADGEITEAELAEQQTALNAAFVEGGIDEALPTALDALSAANAAVTPQEEAIADFLEAAFENELVEAAADDADGNNDGDLEADDVIEADIAEANVAAADVFAKDDEGEPVGVDFVALTDAQQEAEIGLARVDLLAAINDAETDLETAADALEDGVAALVAVADAKAEDLTEALDAVDEATKTSNDSLAIGNTLAKFTADENRADTGATISELDDEGKQGDGDLIVTFANSAEVLTLGALDDGRVTLDNDVAVLADGSYTITSAAGSTLTISATRLDAIVTDYNARLAAEEAQATAEDALAEAINDVLNAQNADLDANFDYANLSAAAADVAGAAVIVEGEANAITIDYDGDSDGGAESDVTVSGVTAVNTYAAAVTAVSDAEEALSDFNDAVTAWEATEVLVDELEALNETLETREAAVTSAEEAITNATDADEDAGLGLNLVAFADKATATADSDVYVFEGDAGQTVTIGAFGAEGTDRLFFGETYTFVEMDADAEIGDALGDVATLEIFAEETNDGVTLYVEDIASAGAGSGATDMTTVELTDVTLADLSFDASGILSAEAAIV